MNKICTETKEQYKILNKCIEIPHYYKDGTYGNMMSCKQTIFKNGKIIGGITIEPSMDNIINIG